MKTFNSNKKIFIKDAGMHWNKKRTRKRRMYEVACPTCKNKRLIPKYNFDANNSTRCESCKLKKDISDKDIRIYWNYVKSYFTLNHIFLDYIVFKKWLLTTNWKKGYKAHTVKDIFSIDTTFTKNRGLPYKDFVIKSMLNHEGIYSYPESYTDKIPKTITVHCKIHGNFKANLIEHSQGRQICPSCYKLKMKQQIGNYSYSEWEKQGKVSKNFDSFKVYILKIQTEKGVLFKIGKTFLAVDKRFNNHTLPYSYEIVEYYEGSASLISALEQEMHNMNKANKIIPKKHFHGLNECFSSYVMPINTLSKGLTHIIYKRK